MVGEFKKLGIRIGATTITFEFNSGFARGELQSQHGLKPILPLKSKLTHSSDVTTKCASGKFDSFALSYGCSVDSAVSTMDGSKADSSSSSSVYM